MIDLASYIRDVPDFPKPGIIFKDITPLLGCAEALRETVSRLSAPYESLGVHAVVGVESRGFIFGALVAQRLGAAFVPIRKPGKLPAATVREDYSLEYGTDAVELHADAVSKGEKVLIVDDLLATGGTMAAVATLVRQLGAEIVEVAFVVELPPLEGRQKLAGLPIHALVEFMVE